MNIGKKNRHSAAGPAPADLGPVVDHQGPPDDPPDPQPQGWGWGWPSSVPIVVGNPTPDFEPKAVDEKYRRTPYRPDTVIDGWSRGAFTVRAASLRGYLHRHNGAPRQDDFALALPVQHDRLIVSVADGVSGASQSHIGSTTAVRYATQWLEETAPDGLAKIDWHSLFANTAWTLTQLAASLLSLPEEDAEQAELILATTLTCVVCAPNPHGGLSVTMAGVGDSGVWVLSEGSFRQVLGGKQASESGLSSSAVSGLPRVPTTVAPVNIVVRPDEVLLIGTDGFGDPLGSGNGHVGALFRSCLDGRVPSLIEFGHVLDFSRETFDDDRTLVAVWPAAPPTPREPPIRS